VTHGAASARAAHAHASGAAGDAASDLAGGDAFAALLSQVAPETVPGNKSVHIHGKDKHASSRENDGDPSDTPDAPSGGKTTANTKGPVIARPDKQIIALADRKFGADKILTATNTSRIARQDTAKPGDMRKAGKQIVALSGRKITANEASVTVDPSHGAPQDAAGSDDVRKTDKHDKKSDHKAAHHKKDAVDTANILTLPVTAAATPVTANVPSTALPVANLAAANTGTEQQDDAVTPLVSGLQPATAGNTGNAPAPGKTGKPAKADAQAPQTASANPQSTAAAPDDTKDSAVLLAQAVNRIIADAAGGAPQTQAPVAYGAPKTDLAHTAHNTANAAGASDSTTAPVTTPSVQAAAVPQPAAPRTVQPPAIPQVAGITAVSTPQAPAVSQPATLSLHMAAPTTDSLPNLNAFALDIAAKSHDGFKQFDIRMDPPELGRVDVHLSIDDSGKVQAHLTADQPQTLALLQKDSTVLRGALRDAGLNMAQNGLNFSLKGQNPQQQSANNGASGRGRSLSLRATAAIDAAQSVIPVFSSTGADTRLDIHV
jgi:flagellar hook-length control protein FliK